MTHSIYTTESISPLAGILGYDCSPARIKGHKAHAADCCMCVTLEHQLSLARIMLRRLAGEVPASTWGNVQEEATEELAGMLDRTIAKAMGSRDNPR